MFDDYDANRIISLLQRHTVYMGYGLLELQVSRDQQGPAETCRDSVI